jgi:opacity protein-like surface antigen
LTEAYAVSLNRFAFAAAFGVAAISALPAAAQMGPPKLDQNGDGRVLYAEYRSANVDKTLETLDADRNGQVSREEFDKFAGMARTFGGARAAAAMDQWWRSTDTNADGAMSRAEMETSSRRRFDAADSNRDGALDKVEVAALRQRQRAASGN